MRIGVVVRDENNSPLAASQEKYHDTKEEGREENEKEEKSRMVRTKK